MFIIRSKKLFSHILSAHKAQSLSITLLFVLKAKMCLTFPEISFDNSLRSTWRLAKIYQ